MKTLSLMIKPASGNCNLRCRYCFYHDIVNKREVASYGLMNLDTLEAIVKRVCSEMRQGECTIAFQGGEPTLAGLDFFKALMDFQKKYKPGQLTFHNALQTNGMIMDEQWARFFTENHFLVGLSLDGNEYLNDLNRRDLHDNGTYNAIMHAVGVFNEYKVEYNILTVVTAQIAKNINKVYQFYKENNFRYQQYIPCLDPLDQPRGQFGYSLSPALYGRFLCHLFDLWYSDMIKGDFVYIRYFENLVGMLMGHLPESCGLIGQCSRQIVIEADGSVYPCDFYVLDQYKIGNLVTDSFESIEESRDKLGFIQQSMEADKKCQTCEWAGLCRGGCRRDKEPVVNGRLSVNYFCESYQQFFRYAYPRMKMLADWL